MIHRERRALEWVGSVVGSKVEVWWRLLATSDGRKLKFFLTQARIK